MSEYLRRLVERHARQLPAVRLRAASRFEGDLVGGLPEAELETEAPAAAIAAFPVETPPPRAAPAHSGLPAHAVEPTGRAEPVGRQAAAEATVEPRAEPSRAEPAPTVTLASRPRSSAKGGPPPMEIRSQAAGRRPAGRRDALPSRHTRASSATNPHTEPDVVHVHIGRVEVRAVVAAPEPPRAVDRRPRLAPQSLERYLSGER